jgi:hypothetical protein
MRDALPPGSVVENVEDAARIPDKLSEFGRRVEVEYSAMEYLRNKNMIETLEKMTEDLRNGRLATGSYALDMIFKDSQELNSASSHGLRLGTVYIDPLIDSFSDLNRYTLEHILLLILIQYIYLTSN